MARFIRSTRNPQYQADSREMFEFFGLPGKQHWPAEGIKARVIDGIWVHVLPVDHVSLNKRPGRKSSKHRVIAACPDCGKAMSAGRLHQHICKGSKES